jgi:hypothetical protein
MNYAMNFSPYELTASQKTPIVILSEPGTSCKVSLPPKFSLQGGMPPWTETVGGRRTTQSDLGTHFDSSYGNTRDSLSVTCLFHASKNKVILSEPGISCTASRRMASHFIMLFVTAAFIISSNILSAQSSGVIVKRGTTAAPFLEIGIGARSVAMGESYVAAANDASAMYWNPAGLAAMETSEGIFSHTTWFAGISLDYAGVAINLGDDGVIGAGLYVMNSGTIAVTTEERPEGNGDLYSVQDMTVGISYARRLTDRFVIGGTVKYIHQSLWQLSASTIAVDGGLQFVTPLSGLTMGLSISNFGGTLQYEGSNLAVRYDPDLRVQGNNDGVVADLHARSWNLPLIFRFGIHYELLALSDHRIAVTSDVLYPNNNNNYLNAGAEYGLLGKFFIRGGYSGLFMPDREGGFSVGGGVNLYSLKIDYAHTGMGRLTSVQRISASVLF